MIEIKNRYTREVIKTVDSDNLIGADLENANLRYADLRCADLRGVYLKNADLENAYLRCADLRCADLENADLRDADLIGADLRYANLENANLIGADLENADLKGADLRGATTDKRYIQISCIGSSKRMTTYCFEDDVIWCGCFTGTLEEFEKQCKETHKGNEQYLKEYLGFINYLKSLK